MAFLDTKHQRALWLVLALGVLIVVAAAPYATGLLGAPVLYVIFQPVHEWLVPRIRSRTLATVIVVLLALVGIVLPITWVVTMLVSQAQGAARAIVESPIMGRLDELTVGPFAVGQSLRELGSNAIGMVGTSAFSLLGKVTAVTLNLLFTFFGFYYILQNPSGAWNALRPYLPFSDANVQLLKDRFAAITKSTLIGTGFCAIAQGSLVALAFMFFGLGNAVFWGAVTMVLSVLPVVGGGMVWGPAAIVLFSDGRTGPAIGMLLWGSLVVSSVDNVLRPWASNRYAQVHPMITLVGAIGGVSYLGILGLLIGPLALSYFFELLAMYQREYLTPVYASEQDPVIT